MALLAAQKGQHDGAPERRVGAAGP
jgi:hypothetical protein